MWTSRRSGQSHQRGQNDHRSPFERDRTRVIHCPAFRRLQRKTQILGTDEGDFHRTRLTHSLEVSSIGCSIVRHFLQYSKANNIQDIAGLLPHEDLITVICLLHDIGHPPFGHGGEVALNYMMRHHGGFEGNAQTLRLVTKLEQSYGEYGLDLTRRSLLGILKYPTPRSRTVAKIEPPLNGIRHQTLRMNDWRPPKSYFDEENSEVAWILEPFQEEEKTLFQSLIIEPKETAHGQSAFHSFDCSIMNIADDIAYGVHDLEDAIHLRLIQRQHLDNPKFHEYLKETPIQANALDALFSNDLSCRKRAIGEWVNYFVTSIKIDITNIEFNNNLLKYNLVLSDPAQSLLSELMQCVYNHVIDSQEARTFEYGGQMVVLRLFEAFSSNPRSLLDHKNRELFYYAKDERSSMRIVCDYIANMTDEYAYRMHERLFGFNTRTVFERL